MHNLRISRMPKFNLRIIRNVFPKVVEIEET